MSATSFERRSRCILGPLEEMTKASSLAPQDRQTLEVAVRNGRRLQKLVNSLLDFARIEADRAQVAYELVDLAVLTANLASAFRSVIEQAGLRLAVDCPPLDVPVYVDREMWEKIVLNLLSNAFKFTFEGEIGVNLKRVGEAVELSVKDTGVGIREAELSRIFERFYRVEGARGRTMEGTSIGLALVHDLVGLHGGSIRADSKVGEGSVFTVSIPTGKDHLPPDRIQRGQHAYFHSCRCRRICRRGATLAAGRDCKPRIGGNP